MSLGADSLHHSRYCCWYIMLLRSSCTNLS